MRCSRVHGYYGYFITDKGDLYSCSFGRLRKLKPQINRHGYAQCGLSNDEGRKIISIHRLVARHFIGLIDYKTVNHKDGNKLNNNVNNLEITSMLNNIEHSFINGLHIYPRKRVRQLDRNGIVIATYPSMSAAERKTGIAKGNISKVVRGILATVGGYVWEAI